MKILLGSHHFSPSTGGIETVSQLLADEFVAAGHEVRVVTQSEGPTTGFNYLVIRRPGSVELLRQVRWCDVFLQNNISLQTVWPLLVFRRPLVITHQTWLRNPDGCIGWQNYLKRWFLRFAKSIAISEAIARELPVASVRIGNPYDDRVFKKLPVERDRELIFVGRLVSDKGVDVLLGAISQLPVKPRLTIVGDGPERARLEQMAANLPIEFVGHRSGEELARLLNQHQILVVPSRWAEPFGIVALEGIACGCLVIGSAEGGLPEAIGPCGFTFPNGDASALASALQRSMEYLVQHEKAEAHVARFTRHTVATKYLQVLHDLT